MGWWEAESSRWECCVVAQAGGAAILGGGVFFLQFRCPEVPVRPVFVAIAGGVGAGGTIGSAVGIPYVDIVRQLINPRFRPPTETYGWSAMDGTCTCDDLQRSHFSIVSVGAAGIVVGAQVVVIDFEARGLFTGRRRRLLQTRLTIPPNLPSFGRALYETPQVQGGFGAGGFGFTGMAFYIGTS